MQVSAISYNDNWHVFPSKFFLNQAFQEALKWFFKACVKKDNNFSLKCPLHDKSLQLVLMIIGVLLPSKFVLF